MMIKPLRDGCIVRSALLVLVVLHSLFPERSLLTGSYLTQVPRKWN